MKELFFDIDTTDSISSVSVKPLLQLVGEPILSLPVGGNYVEEGVLASEVKLGDNDLPYEIVSGNVDVNQKGFYVVKYRAKNTYNWASTAFRAVLVYGSNPDTYYNIAREYVQAGILGKMQVTKSSIPGYWNFSNIFNYNGLALIPAVVADLGDNIHYEIVPGYNSVYGYYQGSIVRELKTDGVSTKKFIISIWFVDANGVSKQEEPTEITWSAPVGTL